MTRQEIIDLIHNEYDHAPADYRLEDNWDDGSERIADAVMNRIEALEADLKVCADRLEENTATMDTARERIEALKAALKEAGEIWVRKDNRIERLEHALRCADQFITNGIELGYIRMPDADTPDSAHKTPGIIRAVLAPEQDK